MENEDTITPQLREVEKDEAKIIATNYFNPVVWAQIKGMAETFVVAKALPEYIKNAAQAVMVLQTGYEMGLKPMEAINSLYMVNGATNIWGKATVGRLRAHGYSIEYLEENDEYCTARVYKKDGSEEYRETFRFADAESSGWTKTKGGSLKIGWKRGQNRKLKMRYGVLSAIIKSYIPDVLGSATEIAEVAEDSRVIDITHKEETTTKEEARETPEGDTGEGRKSLRETLDEERAGEDVKEPEEAEVVEKEKETKKKDGNLVTKARKEMFALSRELGMEGDTAKEQVKNFFKVDSLKDIPLSKLKVYNKALRGKINVKKQTEEDLTAQ